MAKITVLEAKTFQGKPSGFKVTLDNGQSGNLQEKESDKGLRVGDEVNVTLIPYTSKAGVTSNLLGLRLANTAGTTVAHAPSAPAPQSQPTASIKPPNTSGLREARSVVDMKFEARICNMKLAVECLQVGKFERKEVTEAFQEWNTVFDAAIDEIKPSR